MNTKRQKEPAGYGAPEIRTIPAEVIETVLCTSTQSQLETYQETEFEYDD